MEDQAFQSYDLKAVLARRGRLAAAIAGVVLLASIFIAAVLPNEYEAQTVLLIEPQSVSQNLVESGVPETDVNNRLHLIQMQILSRGRLSAVIDDLDVYPERQREMTREELIEYMRENINVLPLLPELEAEARAQSGVRAKDVVVNTFVLTFTHRSASKAADVANRLSRDFIDEHIRERVQVSSDSSQFIDAELLVVADRIGAVEVRIKDVKAANAGRLPEDMSANQRLYERATMALRDAQRELSIAKSDQAFYRQQSLMGGQDGNISASLITPTRKLDLLEVRLAEFGSRGFTEKHPDVIATRDEIDRLRTELASSAEEGEGVSVAQQSARAEEQRAALRAGSAEAEIRLLATALADLEAKLASTPAVAEQLSALEREHEALLASYHDYSGKRVEASVAAAMESRQKGERFRVLESAYPPTEPAAPNRPIILVLGLLLALGLAGGWALLLEMTDDSFHDSLSLQDRMGLPVLAAIPDVVLASDTAASRARDMRQLVLAGAVTAGVLVLAIAGNWWVNGAPGFVSDIFPSAPVSAGE